VTEADTEALDWWYDLEDDFELLSFKAWNAVIYQVTPCSLLSVLCIPRLLTLTCTLHLQLQDPCLTVFGDLAWV